MVEEQIKKAIEQNAPSVSAARELKDLIKTAKFDASKVEKAVWDAIDWQTSYYLSKRFCCKEDVITSVLLGIMDWLGEEYHLLPPEAFTPYIQKNKYLRVKISKSLDDVVTQVSKVFKVDEKEVAELVAFACKSWVDKIYDENGIKKL